MEVSEVLKLQILERLKRTKSHGYGRIARELSTSTRIVEHLDVVENQRFNYTPEGTGRPELEKYKVATLDLKQGSVWNNTDPEIVKAREDYDKGLIELTTGRDGFNLFLYAIPRKVRVIRKPYFVIEKEAV